jgi:hypothetical protein
MGNKTPIIKKKKNSEGVASDPLLRHNGRLPTHHASTSVVVAVLLHCASHRLVLPDSEGIAVDFPKRQPEKMVCLMVAS